MISLQIQHLKPDNIPRPPYTISPPKPTTARPSTKPGASTSIKGKQPATTKSKTPSTHQPKQTGGRRLPIPPDPLPSLASRLSPYSPAVPSGVLIETVKAGMNAQQDSAVAGGAPGAPAVPGGAQKGKRKVVRVRG